MCVQCNHVCRYIVPSNRQVSSNLAPESIAASAAVVNHARGAFGERITGRGVNWSIRDANPPGTIGQSIYIVPRARG